MLTVKRHAQGVSCCGRWAERNRTNLAFTAAATKRKILITKSGSFSTHRKLIKTRSCEKFLRTPFVWSQDKAIAPKANKSAALQRENKTDPSSQQSKLLCLKSTRVKEKLCSENKMKRKTNPVAHEQLPLSAGSLEPRRTVRRTDAANVVVTTTSDSELRP